MRYRRNESPRFTFLYATHPDLSDLSRPSHVALVCLGFPKYPSSVPSRGLFFLLACGRRRIALAQSFGLNPTHECVPVFDDAFRKRAYSLCGLDGVILFGLPQKQGRNAFDVIPKCVSKVTIASREFGNDEKEQTPM